MADKTLTVNGQPFTFNRDRFAGVRTMTVNGETRTVDRTASVIDSDRAGASRPLLSKVVGGAAAAYSLRDLNEKQGNNKVVRVRRDSDNSERDFLAKEVSSGALVDFATSGNGVFQNSGYESFSNASASGFTASNTGSTGFALSAITSGSAGDVVTVTFDLELVSGSPSLTLRSGSPVGTSRSNQIPFTSSGSYTAVLTANGSFNNVGITEGDVPSEFTVSNFKILGNGFVETWYDQSGNGNHAVQATTASQPKIVSSGALVVDSAGLPEIDFDGSNDCLTAPYSRSGEDLPLTIISVFNQDVAGVDYVVALNKSNNNAFDRILLRTNKFEYGRRATDNINKAGSGSDPDVNTKYVFTAINAGTTSSGFVNGSSIFSAVDTNINTQALDQIDIGANNGDSASKQNPFDGKMQEIIIYNSDQSANRPAIEANIANQYGITLS